MFELLVSNLINKINFSIILAIYSDVIEMEIFVKNSLSKAIRRLHPVNATS